MYFEKELELHKEIFSQATPEDQLWHLCEELNEMEAEDKNSEKFLSELADSLFVAISLQRFEHTKQLANMIIYDLYIQYPLCIQKQIDKYLSKAIEKVKSRTYYFVNNHYVRTKK